MIYSFDFESLSNAIEEITKVSPKTPDKLSNKIARCRLSIVRVNDPKAVPTENDIDEGGKMNVAVKKSRSLTKELLNLEKRTGIKFHTGFVKTEDPIQVVKFAEAFLDALDEHIAMQQC